MKNRFEAEKLQKWKALKNDGLPLFYWKTIER